MHNFSVLCVSNQSHLYLHSKHHRSHVDMNTTLKMRRYLKVLRICEWRSLYEDFGSPVLAISNDLDT